MMHMLELTAAGGFALHNFHAQPCARVYVSELSSMLGCSYADELLCCLRSGMALHIAAACLGALACSVCGLRAPASAQVHALLASLFLKVSLVN